MRYKGAVNYYVNLPAEPVAGDVWVVRYQGTSGQVPNGHAYCWENAPITSEKTYIGDVPAYTHLINLQPDIVIWLTGKENKGLAWVGFTTEMGTIFMVPSNAANPRGAENNNFLYPPAFKVYGSNDIYLRKSNFCSDTWNKETRAFNFRRYVTSNGLFFEKAATDDPTQTTSYNYLAQVPEYTVTINGVPYTGYKTTTTATADSFPTSPRSPQYFPSYYKAGNNNVYWDILNVSSDDPCGNFISNRILLDTNGDIVEPGPNTYTLCYAGAEMEMKWVDLGAIGQDLPTDKGVIYYNGICYSSGGGGDTGDFFSRTQIATTTSNLRVLDNSTITADDTIDFRENLLWFYNSGLTFNDYVGTRTVRNNIINLESSNLTIKEDYLYSNLINVTNSTISLKSAKGNFIFGQSHYIDADILYNSYIGGLSNRIVPLSNKFESYYDIFIHGYQNYLYGGSNTDAAVVLLGSYNRVFRQYDIYEEGYVGSDSYYCIGIGQNNSLSGWENYTLGYYNNIGYANYTSYVGRAYQCGAIGIECDIVNSDNVWLIGYNNDAFVSQYSYEIGSSNQIIGGYHNSIIGFSNTLQSGFAYSSFGSDYYNKVQNSSVIGSNNQVTTNETESSYYYDYVNIFGYGNELTSTSSKSHFYIIGNNNHGTTVGDSFVIGQYNNLTNVDEAYVMGGSITLSNTSHVIRLGFYPLVNDDFFAIGNGYYGYDWDLEEFVTNYSSIFRIDSSGNFYLNSTVPLPPVPTSDGSYVLTVSSGASSWTSGGGGTTVIANPAGAATDSLTKISIDNVIYSLSGSGTYVEANPSGTGSTDLTSIEIGSTIYNIPQGVNVVANPSGTAITDLAKVQIGSTIYSIPEGTIVEANPAASATDTLTKLEVGSTVYEVPQGTEVEANPSGSATDTLNKIQVGSTIYDVPSGGSSTLTDLSDVTISSPANGDALIYDSALNKWKNVANSGGETGVVAYSLTEILDSWGNYYGEVANDYVRQFRADAPALIIIGNVCFLHLTWTNTTTHSANQATIMTLKQSISELLCSSNDFLRNGANGSFLYTNKYIPQNASDVWSLWTPSLTTHRVWIEKNNGKLILREEGSTSNANSVYELTMTFTLPISSVGLAHEYSTTEHIVGKWIDGRPIYETTFDLGANTTISNSSWTTTSIQIPNFDGVISGMILTETLGTSTPVMITYDANKYIQLQSLRNSYTSTARYIVIQYTKLTS